MVHYLDPQPATAVPTSCPKCGGHRTEAAGRSRNGRGVDRRCNDCDQRFSMLRDRRASDADNMFFPARKDQDRAQAFDSELLTLDAAPIAPVAPVADIDATDSIGDDVLPMEETPIEIAPPSGSVLHSFVHDFQRLANDCQTLFAS
jgi:hypothetical protein